MSDSSRELPPLPLAFPLLYLRDPPTGTEPSTAVSRLPPHPIDRFAVESMDVVPGWAWPIVLRQMLLNHPNFHHAGATVRCLLASKGLRATMMQVLEETDEWSRSWDESLRARCGWQMGTAHRGIHYLLPGRGILTLRQLLTCC